MCKYNLLKVRVSKRPELRDFILAQIPGDRSKFISAEDEAKKVAEYINGLNLIAFNNRTTWPKDKAPEAYIKQYAPLARKFDLQEEWAIEKTNLDSNGEWPRDFGLIAQLVIMNRGGCCDDLAALAFTYIVRNFKPCAVGLVQVDDTHSYVFIVGKDNSPYVIDPWTKPIKMCPLEKLDQNLVTDKNLTIPFAIVNTGADLWQEWLKLFQMVPANLDKKQDQGPRERQTIEGR
jgi:hypothetical protein